MSLTHSLTLRIPFASKDHAQIACSVLAVDREVKPSQSKKSFNVDGSTLVVEIKGSSLKVVRAVSDGLFEMIGVVMDVELNM
ncbi:CTAG/Pcc1 family, partial [Cladochytrium replicatum]